MENAQRSYKSIMFTRHARRKDVFVENDEILDKLVDKVLVLNLVSILGYGHEGGPEAYGQVVGIHHVFITEIYK